MLLTVAAVNLLAQLAASIPDVEQWGSVGAVQKYTGSRRFSGPGQPEDAHRDPTSKKLFIHIMMRMSESLTVDSNRHLCILDLVHCRQCSLSSRRQKHNISLLKEETSNLHGQK